MNTLSILQQSGVPAFYLAQLEISIKAGDTAVTNTCNTAFTIQADELESLLADPTAIIIDFTARDMAELIPGHHYPVDKCNASGGWVPHMSGLRRMWLEGMLSKNYPGESLHRFDSCYGLNYLGSEEMINKERYRADVESLKFPQTATQVNESRMVRERQSSYARKAFVQDAYSKVTDAMTHGVTVREENLINMVISIATEIAYPSENGIKLKEAELAEQQVRVMEMLIKQNKLSIDWAQFQHGFYANNKSQQE